MNERYEVLKFFENSKDFFENTIQKNIEAYRKGDFSVYLTDKTGKAMTNAKVKVTQKSHAFRFGANLFMLDELETEEKNALYKKRFKEIFNMATLPFYWNSIEPRKGELRYDKDAPKYYRRPPIDLCIEFCQENGIEPREHALAYEQLFPSWLKGYSVDEVKVALEERYKQIAKRYKDKIHTIEVTNEMFWWEGVTPFYDEDDYIEWCFKTAKKHFPSNQLVINEAAEECWCDVRRSTSKYYSYIKNTLLKGAEIDAIGMQFHMFYQRQEERERAKSFYNPTNLYSYLDFYAKLIDTLQITEITIPAYSNNKDDEEIQAKLIEYLYTLWFSHPNVEQIIYWNLVDGYAYVPNPTSEEIRRTQGDMTIGENVYYGGLLRFDMSPKPAYHTLDRLINQTWHTELEDTTNSQGRVDFRGFFGEYEIEIISNDTKISRYVSFNKDTKNAIITI